MIVDCVRKFIERSIQYIETVELDVYEVDISFCFDFVGEGFDKAFNSPCEGAVDFDTEGRVKDILE